MDRRERKTLELAIQILRGKITLEDLRAEEKGYNLFDLYGYDVYVPGFGSNLSQEDIEEQAIDVLLDYLDILEDRLTRSQD